MSKINLYSQNYITFFFIILCLSVGAETYHFLLFDTLESSSFYNRLIINVRLLLPLITFIYLFIFSYQNFSNQINQIDSLFFLKIFFIFQLISTIINIENLGEFHRLLLPLFSLFLLFLVKSITSFDYSKKLFFLFLIILFFLNIVFLKDLYKYFFLYGISDLYSILKYQLPVEAKDFTSAGTNGISRSFLIIYFFILVSYLRNNKNPLLFLMILINIAQYHLQSRFSILILLTLSLFLISFSHNQNIKRKISIFLIIIFIPVLLSTSLSKVKNTFLNIDDPLKSRVIEDLTEIKSTKKLEIKEIIQNSNQLPQFIKSIAYRVEVWNIILKKNDKKLFGYGVLYDRIFLKDIDSHSRTPSNSLFYSYLAGGFFSVFLLLIFYSFLTFRLIVFLLNNLKRKKKFDKYILISLITIFIILLRSIIENSFSIWGLDLIFLTLSINLINSKSKIKI